MGMISEFKEFAMKGNLVDLATGFILGGAFATVVSSLVEDILMPPIGLLMGGIDFSELGIVLGDQEYANTAAAIEAGAPVIRYGQFLNALISFLIVAVVLFFIIKAMNRAMEEFKKKEEEAAAEPGAEEKLLTDIRDLLAAQNAKI